jgi:hypothetical protein
MSPVPLHLGHTFSPGLSASSAMDHVSLDSEQIMTGRIRREPSHYHAGNERAGAFE